MINDRTVVGIYNTRSEAEKGIESLKVAGFSLSDISLLLPDRPYTAETSYTKARTTSEGAAIGAGAGLLFGGALGWLVGIGVLAIPGMGAFIAAGPLATAIASGGIVGTVGGLSGALTGFGIAGHEATHIETRLKNGGILLSIHASDLEVVSKAKQVLDNTGAKDICSTSLQEDWMPGSKVLKDNGSKSNPRLG